MNLFILKMKKEKGWGGERGGKLFFLFYASFQLFYLFLNPSLSIDDRSGEVGDGVRKKIEPKLCFLSFAKVRI